MTLLTESLLSSPTPYSFTIFAPSQTEQLQQYSQTPNCAHTPLIKIESYSSPGNVLISPMNGLTWSSTTLSFVS